MKNLCIPYVVIIILNIALILQMVMNHQKAERIERLETCISNLIDQQKNASESPAFPAK